MKDSELFERAAHDVSFRRAQLEELRYFKKVDVVIIWCLASLGAAISLYYGTTRGSWTEGIDLFFFALLMASLYQSRAIRVAALQAIDRKPV